MAPSLHAASSLASIASAYPTHDGANALTSPSDIVAELLDAPVSNNSTPSSLRARRDLRSRRKTLYGAGPHPMFFHLTFSPADSIAGAGRSMDKEWCDSTDDRPFLARYGAPKVAKTELRLPCKTKVLDLLKHYGYSECKVGVRLASDDFCAGPSEGVAEIAGTAETPGRTESPSLRWR